MSIDPEPIGAWPDGPPATPEDTESAATPPHNLDAEQALLGALLMNNDAVHRLPDFLRDTHFYEPVHGRIFAGTLKLIERGQVADAITLKHYFEDDPALQEVGGGAYLAGLAGAAVSLYDIDHYAATVYELALRRALIEIGDEVRTRAGRADIDEPAPEQIQAAEERLYELAEHGGQSGGFQPFGKALTEAVRLAEAAYNRDSQLVGLPSGMDDLDRKLGGLHKSDLLILASRPAMGKTALATNIAYHIAKLWLESGQGDGAPVAFFSLEMSAEQLATRILSEQAELPSDRIRRGDIDNDGYLKLVRASQSLSDLPLFIDDTPALPIQALRARARRLRRQHKVGLIVVDYLQLLRPSNRSRNDNRVQEIAEITQGLKALAKDLDMPVLALSQLSRAVEQRESKRPQLADLRESGSIEQDADVVMFLYREEYYHARDEPAHGTAAHADWLQEGERIAGLAELIIGKQRHGPTGTIKLVYENDITRFRNYAGSGYGGDRGP